ncbi:signal recognition particle receptor subunit alpha, partial [Candidatus Acetothermia bacterium]|nr:signal recognition particle receptor subunit alpha [Candidatus Acetothermia bacterium]
MAWFKRLKDGLQKTRIDMVGAINELLTKRVKFDAETLDGIEEILVRSDMGIQTTLAIIDDLRSNINHRGPIHPAIVLDCLRAELKRRLATASGTLTLRSDGEPTVIIVVGVNGSGKTTTIAKLAGLIAAQTGCKVTLAAADTFRAAAIEQLEIWAQRVKADVIKHRIGADPSAVVFDAIDHVRSRGGILFIDTAGRLQTKHNLMEELKKIDRT